MYSRNSWIEINASSMKHNIIQYKNIIQNAQLACVIKGNAYGHGAREIINIAKDSLIDWYCTASLSEALFIRTLDTKKPILVLCSIDQNPYLALTEHIDLAVYNTQQLKSLNELAKKHQMKIHIHLKIDTGLSRFGFLPEQALSIITYIQKSPYIALNGIFTHFADAESENPTHTLTQMNRFNKLLYQLQKRNITIPYIHSHATSATIRYNINKTNFMRIGAGIYGLWPSDTVKEHAATKHNITLKQILTWKTRICEIRTFEKNTNIGYGHTYKTTRKTRVAFLPIGYADGYHRRLSNTGKTFVCNNYAPVIGRTAMNVIAIDITNIPSAHIHTEVILMGDHPGITAHDLAKSIESFNPREITTRLSSSIMRKVTDDSIALPKKSLFNKNVISTL